MYIVGSMSLICKKWRDKRKKKGEGRRDEAGEGRGEKVEENGVGVFHTCHPTSLRQN